MLLFYLSMVSTEGERAFIVRAYELLNRRLIGYAYKLSGSAAWAEDAAQQVFLELIDNLQRYQKMTDEQLARYCFVIVKNSFFRWSKRHARLGELALLDIDAAGAPTEDAALSRIEGGRVMAALRALPDAHRMIVLQKFALGRSHKEIAQGMGISVSRSQNLLSEAMREIRRRLGVGGERA